MEKIWRLIVDGARDPYLNMAIDEAIMLRQADAGRIPTLRIYKWLYPCISVGRFQDPLTFILSPLGRGKGEGLPIVRRPTGGGAVIHNEFSFTYSIIYREDSGAIPRGVLNSYKEIHSGIAQALKGLGIEAGFYLPSPEKEFVERRSECFVSPVEFDVMSGGRKIAGAAQRRKFGVVLHQGEVSGLPRQRFWCGSLDLDVRKKWSYNNILGAVTSSFSRQLKAKFVKGWISAKEADLVRELLAPLENKVL